MFALGVFFAAALTDVFVFGAAGLLDADAFFAFDAATFLVATVDDFRALGCAVFEVLPEVAMARGQACSRIGCVVVNDGTDLEAQTRRDKIKTCKVPGDASF